MFRSQPTDSATPPPNPASTITPAIAAATPADSFDQFQTWLDEGCAGEMDYLQRHAEARRHPRSILPDVRSVVMVGMNYRPRDESVRDSVSPPKFGRVARYAQGSADYHDVLRDRLNRVGEEAEFVDGGEHEHLSEAH